MNVQSQSTSITGVNIIRSLCSVASLFLIASMLLLIAPTPAAASTTSLLPTDDVSVKKANPSTNYGSATSVEVDGNSDPEIIYMKFDLSTLSGKTINSAKLHVKVDNSSTGTQNYKTVTDTSWTQSSITYNNKPTYSSSAFATGKGGSSGTYVDIDLTSAVKSKLGQKFAFAIDSTSTEGFGFRSKEYGTAADRPVLVVDYSTTTSTSTPTKAPTATATKSPTATVTKSPTAGPTTTAATATPNPLPTSGGTAISSTISPIADTYVRSDSATSNYGTSTQLYSTGDPVKTTYMKFDLTALAGKTITSASFGFKVSNDSTNNNMIMPVTDTSWSETGMTYNNRPSTGASVASFVGKAVGTIQTVDITNIIKPKLGQVVSFAITGSSTNNFAFFSRESADKPYLTITYSGSNPSGTPPVTLTPSVSVSPSVPPSPSVTATPGSRISGLKNGDVVDGTIHVRYMEGTSAPSHVEFYLNNIKIDDALTTPYLWGGAAGFDTKSKPDGTYTLRVVAYKPNAIDYSETVTFRISNALPTANALSATTNRVKLTATNFYLLINGKKYLGNATGAVSSDPGTSTYTTLELTWKEAAQNNTEMRMFVYFKADGDNWWADEIRTYDGKTPGNWLYYKGQKFTTPMAGTFSAASFDIDNDTTDAIRSHIHFDGLKIQAFLNQPTAVPTANTTPPVCNTREKGDANCDGKVDFLDFEIWRSENVGEDQQKLANFNYKTDNKVDFIDFEIWRQGYMAEQPMTPTPTASSLSPTPEISCAQPVDCAAPPEGCNYTGGNQCACGQLVCETNDLSPTPTPTATDLTPMPPTETPTPALTNIP